MGWEGQVWPPQGQNTQSGESLHTLFYKSSSMLHFVCALWTEPTQTQTQTITLTHTPDHLAFSQSLKTPY